MSTQLERPTFIRGILVLPEPRLVRMPGLFHCEQPGCGYRIHVPDVLVQEKWLKNKRTGLPYVKRSIWTRYCCPNHGMYRMAGGVVNGTYNEKIACGLACRNAIGRSCHCACGGAAHGTGWG